MSNTISKVTKINSADDVTGATLIQFESGRSVLAIWSEDRDVVILDSPARDGWDDDQPTQKRIVHPFTASPDMDLLAAVDGRVEDEVRLATPFEEIFLQVCREG